MNKITSNIRNYSFGLILLSCMGGMSCTHEADIDMTDTDGVVFSANIGQASRRGDNSWTGGELIGMQVGESIKTYRISDAATGAMVTDDEPYTWTSGEYQLHAWSPYTDKIISLTDQSDTEKMFACDLLECNTTVNAKSVQLTFKHKMTRVWYELQQFPGYTDEEANNAVISYYGHSSIKYTEGIIDKEGEPNSEILPRKIDDRHGEAILVPGEMWDKPFIKVVIGGDTYVYTPKHTVAADEDRWTGVLKEGYNQRYYLKVSKKGIEVSMESSSVGWDSETIADNGIVDSKFKINLDEAVQNLNPTLTNIDNNFFISGPTFSLSYTESNIGGLICEGICDMVRTTSGTTHTYTFSNIASDIQIRYIDEYVAVGDYYYSDGTWGSEATKQDCTTLGQVFKVGMNESDDIKNYDGLSKIRGYVVCTSTSIPNGSYAWIKAADGNYKSYLSQLNGLTEDDRQNTEKYLGYQLTKGIESALNTFTSDNSEETLATEFPLYDTFKNLNLGSPDNSSGWYIPSIAQLQDIKSSGIYNGSDLYWSSNVYTEIFGEEVARIWAWEYNMSDGTEKAGWASDPRKLILILTF
ncbi:fimbrillin family protein [Phocaeicola plebeius]|uniref:fimbrillin family protein n=1 Tax=Phocaeicola plebeius TaxID=310297 RepID=UPI0026EA8B1D|nr:fimbrillin family protein [Phocaeicola plebeius]